jgi:hypothetical protein
MVTGDGTCFATGFLTGNGLEKTSRRRRNGKAGFGVQRREHGREKDGFSTRFPVFPFSRQLPVFLQTSVPMTNR